MGRVRGWWSGVGLRTRLTTLYTGLFFAAGTTLLGVTYLLTARALEQKLVMGQTTKELPPPPIESAKPMVIAFKIRQDVLAEVDQGRQQVLSDLTQNSVIIMLAVGVLAIILGHLVADRALRPLRQVTETAERLSESTLHERIALSGPRDDVKRLADTFDAMLDRLQRAFDAQRRFVLNASHELRTPLAINRTLLEVALEEPDASDDLVRLGKALLGTNARHERLIEGLLLLTRSENELVARKPVAVDEVALGVVESLEPQARRRRITVERRLAPAMAAGDPVLVERCVFNLVENALKYNVKDGTVWVDVTAESGGGPDDIVIRVANTGPVIPGYEVADLFEPFHRLRERVGSAQGSGLGLSIVRAIVTAHDGQVEAAPRPDGGLVVTVHLPTATRLPVPPRLPAPTR
ncbi:two-component sensor histidine kinase [Sphaerisporangium melleum]|uniref:histidine kinase n=1 Tax=Sphaerisporangium melleum TaxID=321316 RepID=A0A917QYD1_9ACTN|nr:HAMP domain-containing sensor histidine kinase [Sphaerisporangium melleum]GGK75325.1 two-component sensor histidine kinase [Sphaerisporangium melleum]GII72616.1 two-component sensor histidine kinase [Sphaerisporangium melleum]